MTKLTSCLLVFDVSIVNISQNWILMLQAVVNVGLHGTVVKGSDMRIIL